MSCGCKKNNDPSCNSNGMNAGCQNAGQCHCGKVLGPTNQALMGVGDAAHTGGAVYGYPNYVACPPDSPGASWVLTEQWPASGKNEYTVQGFTTGCFQNRSTGGWIKTVAQPDGSMNVYTKVFKGVHSTTSTQGFGASPLQGVGKNIHYGVIKSQNNYNPGWNVDSNVGYVYYMPQYPTYVYVWDQQQWVLISTLQAMGNNSQNTGWGNGQTQYGGTSASSSAQAFNVNSCANWSAPFGTAARRTQLGVPDPSIPKGTWTDAQVAADAQFVGELTAGLMQAGAALLTANGSPVAATLQDGRTYMFTQGPTSVLAQKCLDPGMQGNNTTWLAGLGGTQMNRIGVGQPAAPAATTPSNLTSWIVGGVATIAAAGGIYYLTRHHTSGAAEGFEENPTRKKSPGAYQAAIANMLIKKYGFSYEKAMTAVNDEEIGWKVAYLFQHNYNVNYAAKLIHNRARRKLYGPWREAGQMPLYKHLPPYSGSAPEVMYPSMRRRAKTVGGPTAPYGAGYKQAAEF